MCFLVNADASNPAVITLLLKTIPIGKTVTINNKHIKIVPAVPSSPVTIKRGAVPGYLFNVESGGSLTLEGNGSLELVIDGNKDAVTASGSLIEVFSGKLTMNAGVTLKNNRDGDSSGGVYVNGAGTFMMTGGEISKNMVDGDGVCVTYGGIFTMVGGTISGNTAVIGGGPYIPSDTGYPFYKIS